MKAIVSGQAEKAVYWEGETIWCLRLDGDGPFRCFEEDIPRLMGRAADVRAVDRDSLEQIIDELELSWAQDRALQLALILFDADAEEEDRREAAGYIEKFFEKEDVRDFVANRFYSAELPPEADLLGAILSADATKAPRVANMLEHLGRDQPKIKAYQRAFDALPTTLFGDPQARERFRIVAVTSGAWRDFVEAPTEDINRKRVKYMRPESPLADLDLHGQILAQWTKDLRIAGRPEVVSEKLEEEPAAKDRQRQPKATGHETFEAVERQKAAIRQAMQQGDAHRVGRFVDDLVRFQRERSEPALLAKSLCDLATYAKDRGDHSLQLDLARRAVVEAPADGWARCQLADAHLCCGRIPEAQAEYERTIAEFPNEVVARSGRAEVLKARGQFDEALAEYDRTIKDFPTDVVARTGRAEVLKARGRFDEALAEYDRAIQDFPSDVVARSGRAEVLKAGGRFEDALAEYERTIEDFPSNVVARTGRLAVLVLLKRYAEVLQLRRRQDPVSRDEWIDHHIIGMALLKSGELKEAISVFQEGLDAQRNPWAETRPYYRRVLAVARIQQSEFETALQDLEGSDSPVDNVIRAHALFMLEKPDEAIKTLDRLPEKALAPLIELSADLRARYVTKTLTEEADARILDNECRAVLMAA